MWLAKLTVPELLSSYQTIINKSFSDAEFPNALKHAIVRPNFKEKQTDISIQ